MKNPTIRVVTATEAQTKFGEVIKHAYADAEHLIVEKGGIPVVAIIPIAVYKERVGAPAPAVTRRVASPERRAEAARRLGKLLERVHAEMPNVPEEEVERDINKAVQQVRAERAKRVLAEQRAAYKTRSRRAPRARK
jgi:prevent-host-death family protein